MFAEATVTGRGNDLHVVHGTDENLLVRFYHNKIHERDYVKINIPGDKTFEWDQPVREVDKQRFRGAWEAFKAQQNQLGNQVLLAESSLFDEAKIKTYREFNIETVEQLANLNDAFISKIGMGTREDVRKASNYLAAQSDVAKQLKLEKELQSRDEKLELQAKELEDLKAQMAQLVGALASAPASPLAVETEPDLVATHDIHPASPKRGRPAKTQE